MLHQSVEAFVPVPTFPVRALATPTDIERARTWIAAARECGMVIAPWRDMLGTGVLQTGQDEDGPNHWAAVSDRLMRHPASPLKRDLPNGLVFELLCEEMGLDPTDPNLCQKVNARLASREVTQ